MKNEKKDQVINAVTITHYTHHLRFIPYSSFSDFHLQDLILWHKIDDKIYLKC